MSLAVFAASILIMNPETTIDLKTPWSDQVSQTAPHPEYPRPGMIRPDWLSLNGPWDYSIQDRGSEEWEGKQGSILVPFPVESKLSGVQKTLTAEQRLWQKRTFSVPEGWNGQNILLNFEAVDWEAEVYVNGKLAGTHRGGYSPFSFDITEHLTVGQDQELEVRVYDPTDDGFQPVGKQTKNPRGIWYTAVSGIWASVWLEPVPINSISSVKLIPNAADARVSLSLNLTGSAAGHEVKAVVKDGGKVVGRGFGHAGRTIPISISSPKRWSPDSPHLYDVEIELISDGETVDRVTSYFGLRDIELKTDEFGPRIYLNDEPIFTLGPLDQGWWPDGLYTAPTDEALRYDLEITKKAGFNSVRKHVKVEPRRWYRHCDELGLMVWQDMPNTPPGKGGPPWDRDWKKDNPNADWKPGRESDANFRHELTELIDHLVSHPSIVIWVPFNEAWGQFDTKGVTEWIQGYDPSRLVNSASGGNFVKTGDILDIHAYPGPATPDRQEKRSIVLGEFGGLGLPVKDHLWQDNNNWGYQSFEEREALADRYEQLLLGLMNMKGEGLSGAIYTQTTDVEGEVNGLMTYDRQVIKIPLERLNSANQFAYGAPPMRTVLVPTSEKQAQIWRYTTVDPGNGWTDAGFDDSAWQEGPGGFGTATTPGAVVGTEWSGEHIWLRRIIAIPQREGQAWLRIHHDEDAEVWLNGKKIADLSGYTSSYVDVPIKDQGLIKKGTALLAVRCRQTSGGQFIDVGFSEISR
jgi:beta-galactosidase/beta-glucuronidase